MKNHVFAVILLKTRLENLPFYASKWMATKYFGQITSNYIQNNYSKSNWSWQISKTHFRNTTFVSPLDCEILTGSGIGYLGKFMLFLQFFLAQNTKRKFPLILDGRCNKRFERCATNCWVLCTQIYNILCLLSNSFKVDLLKTGIQTVDCTWVITHSWLQSNKKYS